jgi:hypothetical protein
MGWERDVKEERREGSRVYLKCQQPTKSGSTPLSISTIAVINMYRSSPPPSIALSAPQLQTVCLARARLQSWSVCVFFAPHAAKSGE